jgi:CRISPR-associated protein Cas2
MKERLHIFCYDISDDTRRLRVARRLETVALRVQGSVFEWRADPAKAQAFGRRLAQFLAPEDSLRIYMVPDSALPACAAHGGMPVAEPGRYFLV